MHFDPCYTVLHAHHGQCLHTIGRETVFITPCYTHTIQCLHWPRILHVACIYYSMHICSSRVLT
jgi:hypothetical protein